MMSVAEPAYFSAFKNLAFSRTPSGVLAVRFHTDGGPATFTGQLHSDLPWAIELAETLAAKPQLLSRYLAVALRQRVSRRMAEATGLGLALEGLTAADLASQG
jgi:hypothetical protein